MRFCNDCQVGPTGKVTLCAPCARRMADEYRRIASTYKGRLDHALAALDLLGVALANHNHQWSAVEREAYEYATDKPYPELEAKKHRSVVLSED